MELIKITENNNKQVVSARELYFGLGYNQTDYSKWVKRSITENEYFIENEDWVEIGIDAELLKTNKLPPRPSKDYALSLTMAKKLAMMAKTEIGNKYRDYFIACEKKLQQQFQIPQTYAEALMLAAKQAEELEVKNKELSEARPKVEFYDAVTGSSDTIDMREVAGILNMGVGRNKIFAILRDRKILDRKNTPYQSYIDRGYFRTIESSYTKPDGTTCISIKTVIFQKGLDFIRKTINKHTSDK